MRKLLLLIVVTLALSASAELKYLDNSWKDYSAKDKEVGGKNGLGTTNTTWANIEWPRDPDGEDNASLLIVSFQNMGEKDIEKLGVNVGRGSVIKKEAKHSQAHGGLYTLFIYLTPGKDQDITLRSENFGNVRIPAKDYRNHGVYEATVLNAGLTNISITSDPKGATVTLDGKKLNEVTPLTLKDIYMGGHRIALSPANPEIANAVPETTIDVSSSMTIFNFDMRKTKTVKIVADPSDSYLRIMYNNQVIEEGKGSITLVDVPYEFKYTIEASKGKEAVRDYLFIDANTPSELKVKLLGTRTISFYAKQNNNIVDDAVITVNGQYIGETPVSKLLDFGKYEVRASKYGYTGVKKVKIGKNTKDVMIKIPNSKSAGYHPYDIDYNSRAWGIALNYVYKYFNYKKDGRATKYNWIGEEGGSHGFQAGIVYEPYFGYGQGLSTGAFIQGFFGKAHDIDRDEVDYEEWSIYVPFQYQFRLPLGANYSIALNAGAALSYGFSNKFSFSDKSSLDLGYGWNSDYDMYFPDPFDYYITLGAAVQMRAFQIEAKYNIGLKDHKVMHNPNDSGSLSYKSSAISIGFSLLM